jgi:flagellar basal-body rod protein FlgF
MENATTIALSRLVAQARAMDVTATNIANAATTGFRRERMIFADFLVREPGALPGGERELTYAADRSTYRDRQPGTFSHTGDALDLAISGDGYFTVQGRNGPRLTRAGHFSLSAAGGIVDDDGDALLDPTGQPLQVGTTDTRLSIAADGTISSETGQLGKVGIVTADDPNKLKAEGGTLLSAADTTTTAVSAPKLVQGALEASDVQPAVEMASMMTTMREFQFVSQFVQSEADRQKDAIDKIMQTHS